MTTDVKWFSSEMAGAPAVSGSKGSLLGMLNACMVSGFGLKSVNTMQIAGQIATVTLSGGTFFKDQIVLVSGAFPAALNGEFRVLSVPTANSFTYAAVGVPDGTGLDVSGTNTITVKTAPLGWLQAFSGTNSGAFKIDPVLHSDTTGCLVRVSDTGNYNAQITGYESMSGVDTGAAPFPTPGQQTLWVFRSNTASPDAVARSWFVVGDSRFVYVGIHAYSSSATSYGADWFGFGEFKSKRSADPFRFALTGNSSADTASTSPNYSLAGTSNGAYAWLARSYTGLGGSIAPTTETWPTSYGASGAGPLPYPNGPDYGLYLCKAQIFEASPVCYRGDWPGIYFIPQNVSQRICTDVRTAYLDTAVPGFENKVVGFFPCDYSSAAWGVVAFDLTGPWEH